MEYQTEDRKYIKIYNTILELKEDYYTEEFYVVQEYHGVIPDDKFQTSKFWSEVLDNLEHGWCYENRYYDTIIFLFDGKFYRDFNEVSARDVVWDILVDSPFYCREREDVNEWIREQTPCK